LFHISHISLTQFRNYGQQAFSFPKRVIGLCGSNGIGKTNLLDAIYYLCFTRSYFSRTDAGSVQIGSQGFRLEGNWNQQGQDLKTVCIVRETGKKELWVDQDLCPKFSAHIGRFPVVFIAPDDIILITGGAEERRRFMDTLLSQLYPDYLKILIRYNKILQERNSFLKNAADSNQIDTGLLEILDHQLTEAGTVIFSERKKFMESFLPEVQHFYAVITSSAEKPVVAYSSPLLERSFPDLLMQNRTRDLAMQRTSSGIHRDDLELKLNEEPFKNIASQGQRKSLLFALKLAEFNVLKKAKGFPPLLLLDDIFEKLDEARMQNLLHWVCRENTGQVFLTDTHCDRIKDVMEKIEVDCQLIELS
jgi:DNA replication and repair protein RecF